MSVYFLDSLHLSGSVPVSTIFFFGDRAEELMTNKQGRYQYRPRQKQGWCFAEWSVFGDIVYVGAHMFNALIW